MVLLPSPRRNAYPRHCGDDPGYERSVVVLSNCSSQRSYKPCHAGPYFHVQDVVAFKHSTLCAFWRNLRQDLARTTMVGEDKATRVLPTIMVASTLRSRASTPHHPGKKFGIP